jgi:dTDP-4-amino-4,6-dideoxygalactose transaminase
MIGGVFGLIDRAFEAGRPPGFMRDDPVLLANGQSALQILVHGLDARRVWIPSYTCEAVVSAVQVPGVDVRFYEIDQRLRCSTDWLDAVRRRDMVVFIDYFGYPADPGLMRVARVNGAWIVRDAAQALLTPNDSGIAHFTIYSPRKYLGVPDGGILAIHERETFEVPPLQPPPDDWWALALSARTQRSRFDRTGEPRGWFELYQRAERTSPVGPFRMSDLTRDLLMHHIDEAGVKARRILNYSALAERLSRWAVMPELPEDVVPLGFPIRLECRDAVRQHLFAHEIFPQIHWAVPQPLPPGFEDSRTLATQILTLPCDQRYGPDDMAYMAALVEEVIHDSD